MQPVFNRFKRGSAKRDESLHQTIFTTRSPIKEPTRQGHAIKFFMPTHSQPILSINSLGFPSVPNRSLKLGNGRDGWSAVGSTPSVPNVLSLRGMDEWERITILFFTHHLRWLLERR